MYYVNVWGIKKDHSSVKMHEKFTTYQKAIKKYNSINKINCDFKCLVITINKHPNNKNWFERKIIY